MGLRGQQLRDRQLGAHILERGQRLLGRVKLEHRPRHPHDQRRVVRVVNQPVLIGRQRDVMLLGSHRHRAELLGDGAPGLAHGLPRRHQRLMRGVERIAGDDQGRVFDDGGQRCCVAAGDCIGRVARQTLGNFDFAGGLERLQRRAPMRGGQVEAGMDKRCFHGLGLEVGRQPQRGQRGGRGGVFHQGRHQLARLGQQADEVLSHQAPTIGIARRILSRGRPLGRGLAARAHRQRGGQRVLNWVQRLARRQLRIRAADQVGPLRQQPQFGVAVTLAMVSGEGGQRQGRGPRRFAFGTHIPFGRRRDEGLERRVITFGELPQFGRQLQPAHGFAPQRIGQRGDQFLGKGHDEKASGVKGSSVVCQYRGHPTLDTGTVTLR